MKPKIFVFTTAYHPFIGGAEIAIQEVARRLKDRFDFYIVTSRLRRDLPKREERPEGTVIRLGFGNTLDKWLLPVFVFCNLEFGIWNFTRRGRVLWGMDIGMGSLTAAVLKLFRSKTPFIFTIQYGYGEERLKRGRLGLIRLAFRFILSRADQVTAISTYLLDLAEEYGYKGPGEVIHNGVDIERFTKHVARNMTHDRRIITTSRLVQKNGIDTLIDAVAEVKKEIPEIQCWILGEGPERHKLELQATSYKLQANVKFFGSVPYEEVPRYLHQADVFVRPSRSEGMGNSFVEALAAGLPIIGTPVGGIKDIIISPHLNPPPQSGEEEGGGVTGLYAKVDDPKDLAEKIKTLLRDEKLAASIVKNGRRMVEERFSWDKIAEQYQAVFTRGLALNSYEAKPRSLNILIATPLFPPQLGGPALYAKHLGEELVNCRHQVSTVSFGRYLRYPSGIRHLLYFTALARLAIKSDLIFALDYTSVGLPAAVVSLIFRKPLVIRVEGDFLWESFVERTRKDITLRKFYSNPPSPPFSKNPPASPFIKGGIRGISWKEKLIQALSGWVMRHADRLVFSSEWRRKMVAEAYGIHFGKTAIIRNVLISPKSKVKGQRSKVILWAGRMLYLKNLYRLINAFQGTNAGGWELHLVGDGPERKNLEEYVKKNRVSKVFFFNPLSHDELLQKFQSSEIFILPSLSEVGPNVISDAVFTGTPFIMTEETGYVEYVQDAAILVDPLDGNDIAAKLKLLMDDKNRERQKEKIRNFRIGRSWREAAEEWSNFFQKVAVGK